MVLFSPTIEFLQELSLLNLCSKVNCGSYEIIHFFYKTAKGLVSIQNRYICSKSAGELLSSQAFRIHCIGSTFRIRAESDTGIYLLLLVDHLSGSIDIWLIRYWKS